VVVLTQLLCTAVARASQLIHPFGSIDVTRHSVTTLQGRLVQQESGGACAILGMTLSRTDLVFVCSFVVRSVQQRKATPWLLSESLKGLILKARGRG